MTIIPMFLTDCDKSHLFSRHGEIQIWGAEGRHSASNRSRSFGPGDIQGEPLANRQPTTSPPPRLLAGLRRYLPRSVLRIGGLRSVSFSNLFSSMLAPLRGARFLFLLWGGRGQEDKGKKRKGETKNQSWATGKPVALDRKILTGQETLIRLCEASAVV